MKKITDLQAASSQTRGMFCDLIDNFQSTCPTSGQIGIFGDDPNSGLCGD